MEHVKSFDFVTQVKYCNNAIKLLLCRQKEQFQNCAIGEERWGGGGGGGPELCD